MDNIDVILENIKGIQQQITKLESRLDLMTVTMHEESTEGITDNSSRITDTEDMILEMSEIIYG